MSVFIHGMGDLDVMLARGGGGGATITISDTEPENPPDGMLWFDWSAPSVKIRYDYKTWIELLPTLETPTGPPEVRPPPGPGPGPGPGPTPTPPWQMTYTFSGSQVTFQNDPTGRIALTDFVGWDPEFAQDLNDQALYLGPNAPTSPANQVVRLFATFAGQPEVEVEFDKFTLGTPAGNHITIWGFASAGAPPQPTVDSIYIQGSNSTSAPIELRLEKT